MPLQQGLLLLVLYQPEIPHLDTSDRFVTLLCTVAQFHQVADGAAL